MNKKALASIFSVFLLAAGCSNNNEVSQQEEPTKEVTQEETKEATKEETKEEAQQNEKQEQKEGTDNMKVNAALTKKVKEENKEVTDANVFEKDGKALGRFIVDKKVNEKEAKDLVEKIAKDLEKEYKDKEVNVQAIKEGKVIAETTAGVKKPVEDKKTAENTEGKKTAEQLKATVVNSLPGVFAIKIPLKEANSIEATEKSKLVLEVEGKGKVTLKYNAENKVFLNSNIQGDYTVDELSNALVVVK